MEAHLHEITRRPEHDDVLTAHAVDLDIADRLSIHSASKGITIPWPDGAGGHVMVGRLDDQHRDEGVPKYIWPAGQTTFPAVWRSGQPEAPVVVVEGTLQSLAALSAAPEAWGVIGMNGCDGIHGASGEMSWARGRDVTIVFDADVTTNSRVAEAAGRVTRQLLVSGASSVSIGRVPARLVVGEKDGLDDALARVKGYERAEVMHEIVSTATRSRITPGVGEGVMTDSVVAAEFAQACLIDRYLRVAGLGWHVWTGAVWQKATQDEVVEVMRQWVLSKRSEAKREAAKHAKRGSAAQTDEHRAAAQKAEDDANATAKAWEKYQTAARVNAVTQLAGGTEYVYEPAGGMDAHPDLLNVRNGVVNLRTGELGAHDPALRMTKIVPTDYRPEATHPDWDLALEAVPVDVRPWLQLRLGQALTGYVPDDDAMLVMDGRGANGKSTLCDAVRYALGRDDAYAVLLGHRAILGDASQHPTELMTLRGARMAFVEELPEGHRLNITRLKTLVGTSTIRARLMRQDEVAFDTTHSMVMNTNYLPIVDETDHGTWRRLRRVRFPYVFRPAEAPLEAGDERHGDAGIKLRLQRGEAGQHEAVLAWLVDGAMRWYAQDRQIGPDAPTVARDTYEWRAQGDPLMQFADEHLVFETEARMPRGLFHQVFNEFLTARGHSPWSARLVTQRVRDHSHYLAHRVKEAETYYNGVKTKLWLNVRLRGSQDKDQQQGDQDQQLANSVVEHMEQDACYPGSESPPVELTSVLLQAHHSSSREMIKPPEAIAQSEVRVVQSAMRQADVTLPDGMLAFDLETAGKGLDMWRDRSDDFVRLAGVLESDRLTVLESPVDTLARLAAPGGPVFVNHNIMSFDLVALASRRPDVDLYELAKSGRVLDTMIAWVLANPPTAGTDPGRVLKAFSLDNIASRFLGHGKQGSLHELAREFGGYGEIPLDDQRYRDYAMRDVEIVGHLAATLSAHGADLADPYVKREHEVAGMAAYMRLNGWRIDTELLRERIEAGQRRRHDIIEWLHKRHGMPLGGSAPQRSDAGRDAIDRAFSSLGYSLPRTDSGKPSSAKLVMESIRDSHPGTPLAELAEAILALNGVRTIYDTIERCLVGDRVHPEITMYQSSGRWSITEPGLTVVGKRGGRHVERSVFLPEPGHVIMAADLSQIDARAVAAHCGDPGYAALFGPDRDLHGEIAKTVWKASESDPDWKLTRFRAKAIGHGWNYGMGLEKLAEIAGDRDVAEQFDHAMRENYPGLVAWKRHVSEAGENGQRLANAWGRPLRPDPERSWTQAPALIGQSTARDAMCQWLMNAVDGDSRIAGMLRGMVHDEVVLSVPVELEAEVADHLIASLPAPLQVGNGPEVPVLAEVSPTGRDWGEVYEK